MPHTTHSVDSGTSRIAASRIWFYMITFLLSLMLSACGNGSGDGGISAAPASDSTRLATGGSTRSPEAEATFRITADHEQTAPGGASVTLTTSGLENPAQTQWSIAAGSRGELSQETGASVQYRPPPAGTPLTSRIVTIAASNGTATASINILLSPETTTDDGTDGAGSIAPPPSGDDVATAGPTLFLLAGNDFGAGIADGTGTSARFGSPTGIARAEDGTLYVADSSNNTIRKISSAGAVSTLAGLPGERGHVDGKGTAARFAFPRDVAVGPDGNIYVVDSGDSTIRRVTPEGDVTTIAGAATADGFPAAGTSGIRFNSPIGIAVDDAGTIYVADWTSVYKVTPDGSVSLYAGQRGRAGADDGPAVTASFVSLAGITVDHAGNVYVTDSGLVPGQRMTNSYRVAASVRKISTDGVVSTIAGTAGNESVTIESVIGYADGKGTDARFSYPQGITVDHSGNLFVADRGNHAVRRIAPDGTVTTLAGSPTQAGSTDGSIDEARFWGPYDVAAGSNGKLYVTDSTTVRRLIPGDEVTTFAGTAPRFGSADGVRSEALFYRPRGITRDAAGILYVADSGNHTIRRITPDGVVTTYAGGPGMAGNADGPAADARFNEPSDVASIGDGSLLVSDYFNDLLRRISTAGVVSSYSDSFPRATAVDADAAGNIFVAARDADRVFKIAPDGSTSVFVGPDTSLTPVGSGMANGLIFPKDIAVDKAGNLYVVDIGSSVRKVTPDGTMTTLAGAPFDHASRDGTGTEARFNFPHSLTVDDDGNVYVADARAIRKVTPEGVVTTVAGALPEGQAGTFLNVYQPTGLAMTGPKTLAFTAENGVFELRLP